jgi:hypothetical protein
MYNILPFSQFSKYKATYITARVEINALVKCKSMAERVPERMEDKHVTSTSPIRSLKFSFAVTKELSLYPFTFVLPLLLVNLIALNG